MPERLRSILRGAWFRRRRRIAPAVLAIMPVTGSAQAQDFVVKQDIATKVETYLGAFGGVPRHEVAALALTLGVLLFAVVTAVMLVRARRHAAEAEAVA